MRILHVVHTPRYSGAEMLVASLANNHVGMGHPSCVVSINPPEEDFNSVIAQQERDGIRWITPSKKLGRLSRAPYIRKIATKFGPDVTFAHSVIPAAYARMACARHVITVLHSETNYESGYLRYFEKLFQYRLSGVISVSEIARQQYTADFRYPRTSLIPNGTSLTGFERTGIHRKLIRESLGFGGEHKIVVQIGRIAVIKQQRLSIQAISSVIKRDPSVHFVLAGLIEDALYFDDLKRMARNDRIENNVHFLGPRKDVADLLCAADLFLMPSVREAQGIAMIEALAAGLPIIATAIPGFEYARAFEGVRLLRPEELEEFSASITEATTKSQRYSRDLSGFDIRDTALAYLNFAAKCTS